jgi:hypothetical protein
VAGTAPTATRYPTFPPALVSALIAIGVRLAIAVVVSAHDIILGLIIISLLLTIITRVVRRLVGPPNQRTHHPESNRKEPYPSPVPNPASAAR